MVEIWLASKSWLLKRMVYRRMRIFVASLIFYFYRRWRSSRAWHARWACIRCHSFNALRGEMATVDYFNRDVWR